MVALSLLMVVVASSIWCITPTDPAEVSERGELSAVRGAGTMPPIDVGEAINITANNETIKGFISQKFCAESEECAGSARSELHIHHSPNHLQTLEGRLSGTSIGLQTSVSRLSSGRSI